MVLVPNRVDICLRIDVLQEVGVHSIFVGVMIAFAYIDLTTRLACFGFKVYIVVIGTFNAEG